MAALACVVVQSAHADEQSPTLRITVVVVSPVSVLAQIESETDPTDRRDVVLSDRGTTTVRNLNPGSYRLQVSSGSASATLSFQLLLGEVVSLKVSLAAGGQPQLILTDRRSHLGTMFTRNELRELPSGLDLFALVDTAVPFAITDRIDSGSMETGKWGVTGSRGASWTANTVVLGDLQTTNPARRRDWSFVPDLAVADHVAIFPGALGLKFDAPGTAIVIQPKRPGQTWSPALDMSFTAPRMVSPTPTAIAPAVGRIDTFSRNSLDASGGLGEQVGLLIAASHLRSSWRQRSETRALEARATTLFTYLTARPSDHDEVRIQTAAQRIVHPYDARRQFRGTDSTQRDMLAHVAVTWDRKRSNGTQQEVSVTMQRTAIQPRVSNSEGGSIDRVFEGPIVFPIAEDSQRHLSGRATVDLVEFGPSLIRHSVRLGASVDHWALVSRVVATPAVAELVAGAPARVWLPEQPPVDALRTVVAGSIYVVDRIAVGSRLSIDLGLRADVSRGEARGSSDQPAWQSVVPLGAVRWAPMTTVAISGWYRQYRPPVSLAFLAFGDPAGSQASVHRWTDVNRNQAYDGEFELGPLVARSGTNAAIASIDPTLTGPRTEELAISAESRLGSRTTLRATFTVRRDLSQVRSVNIGAPLTSYRPVQILEDQRYPGAGTLPVTIYERLPSSFGADRYVLRNPSDDSATYRGLEVAWEFRTRRWYSMAGAMWYRTLASGGNRGYRPDENDLGVIGERFESPNAAPVTEGHSFFDREYVLKWSTSYRPGRGIVASVTARYQDGLPFARIVVVPDLTQGTDYAMVDRSGHTRFTFTATIDARLQKTFAVRRTQVRAGLDAFNLTNRANEVDEDPVSGPTFRRTTAVQPPRTLRISLHFQF